MSDPRALQAREAHRLAGLAARAAAQHRETRDHLVRALRDEDRKYWTYERIAREVGCSPELVWAILNGRTASGRSRARAKEDR